MKHSKQGIDSRMNEKNHSQAGFAAILVTLIVVGLITLMTVGFLQVVSREGRDSLDRQLSTQAFYAAEAGVNDAERLIRDDSLITTKTDCAVPDADGWNSQLSAGIEYTCVLAEFELDELYYQNIATEHARPIRLNAVDMSGSPTQIGQINILWRSAPESSSNDMGAAGIGFPPAGESNFGPDGIAPVLRVTITPLSNVSNPLHRQSLIQNTFTTFLRPTEGGTNASVNYAPGNPAQQGAIQQVDCDTTNDRCSFSIGNLAFQQALLTVRAIYGEAELTIESASLDVRFRDEQVLIDSTGRASDVLRRIQVRLSDGGAPIPSFAIEAAAGVCKDYEVGGSPGSGSVACQIN